MSDFNSVPPASEDVYGKDAGSGKDEEQEQQSKQKQDSSGPVRKGDREGQKQDKKDSIEGKVEEKLKDKAVKTGAKMGAKAAAGAVIAGAQAGAGTAAAGAVKAVAAVAKSVPTMILTVIGGFLAAIIGIIAVVATSVTPVLDAVPDQPTAYVYRAAIGYGTSQDASLLDSMRRESARRIYTVLGGFKVMDWPDSSVWPNSTSEYHVVEKWNGADMPEVSGTKKITYGLRPEQIFGALGNMTVESGLDPTAVETIYDEPWMIGKNKQWAMANDWVVELWASDLIGNKDYFENENPLIHRNGIGLCQWTDVKGKNADGTIDDSWTYDVHNPGRNSLLMQYAKLFAMSGYTGYAKNSSASKPDRVGWNSEEWIKGDTTIEGFWYDMDVQLAFMLDKSDIGDSMANWLWQWSEKGSGTYKGLFAADEPVTLTEDDFTPVELRGWRYYNWYQGKAGDNPLDRFENYSDDSNGVTYITYGGSVKNPITGTIDPIGDGTKNPVTFTGGQLEIDDTETPTKDTYYDANVIPGGANIDWVRRETDAGEDYGSDHREVWYGVSGGVFQIKYKDTKYNAYTTNTAGHGGIPDGGYNEVEVIFSGIDAIREQAKVRAIDRANDDMELFIKRYNSNRDDNNVDSENQWVEHSYGWNADNWGHVASWEHCHNHACTFPGVECDDCTALCCPNGCKPVTHYFIVETGWGGEQINGCWNHKEDYYNTTGTHAQALTNADWTECFKYFYRKYLYEGMTAYFTAQFLIEYEGVPIAYEDRLNAAFEYFDFWWDLASEEYETAKCEPNVYYEFDHMGVDVESTRNKGPYAQSFEDWFFHVEQAYSQGIISAIDYTANELTEKQKQQGKIWTADQVMFSGVKTMYESHKDLARAGCLIAWPTIADSRLGVHSDTGTELYHYIHDKVIEGDSYYASCDRSVCTAVRWSGFDDNFPAGDTTVQLDYLVSSPNWVEIDWGGNPDMLQPGDILIRKSHLYKTGSGDKGDTAHHIIMYVGNWMAEMNGKVGLTEAERDASQDVVSGSSIMHGSFGERTPGIGQFDTSYSNYHAFRCMFPMAEGTSKYVGFHYDE